jgi:hypothetical protein
MYLSIYLMEVNISANALPLYMSSLISYAQCVRKWGGKRLFGIQLDDYGQRVV